MMHAILFTVAVLLLLPVESVRAGKAAGPDARLNIAWFVVDDMSANCSCHGEALMQTPHVDRLAREETRFANAFVTAPLCSPCRPALIAVMTVFVECASGGAWVDCETGERSEDGLRHAARGLPNVASFRNRVQFHLGQLSLKPA